MKYYWLSTTDQRNVNWIIFEGEPPRIRYRYAAHQCELCGKIDEWSAITSGIDEDVQVRAETDFLTTDDGFFCVGKRAQRFIENAGILGMRFLPLKKSNFAVTVPTDEVAVARQVVRRFEEQKLDFDAIAKDPASISTARVAVMTETDACGMEFSNKCPNCGRFEETLYWPTLHSLSLPVDPMVVLAPDVAFEHRRNRETWYLATDRVTRMLTNAGFTGLEFLQAK